MDIYLFAMRMFPGDGVVLYAFMREYGNVPLPPKIKKAREDTWNKLSMELLRQGWA